MTKLDAASWKDVKRRFPLKSIVVGTVVRVEPFGVFVSVPQCDAHAVLLVTEFQDGDRAFDVSEYPEIGSQLTAVVVDHAEHNRQLRVSTRRSRLESAED